MVPIAIESTLLLLDLFLFLRIFLQLESLDSIFSLKAVRNQCLFEHTHIHSDAHDNDHVERCYQL